MNAGSACAFSIFVAMCIQIKKREKKERVPHTRPAHRALFNGRFSLCSADSLTGAPDCTLRRLLQRHTGITGLQWRRCCIMNRTPFRFYIHIYYIYLCTTPVYAYNTTHPIFVCPRHSLFAHPTPTTSIHIATYLPI